jgi:hypothetical protein
LLTHGLNLNADDAFPAVRPSCWRCWRRRSVAVIVAVRRPHHGVDMVAGRLLMAERNAALTVEFDEHNRTVHAVIEHAVLVHPAHPDAGGVPLARLGSAKSGLDDVSTGQPCRCSDFPKLSRDLGPGIASVVADVHLAEQAEGEDAVGLSRVRGQAPDG